MNTPRMRTRSPGLRRARSAVAITAPAGNGVVGRIAVGNGVVDRIVVGHVVVGHVVIGHDRGRWRGGRRWCGCVVDWRAALQHQGDQR